MAFLIPHLIDRSAERYPDHDAFRWNGRGLTYAELARRANGLARFLRENGVTKGDRIGVYLNKSLETAVSVYGIMKAGAAYVPLDPLAPESRVAFIVRDCGIRWLLADAAKQAVIGRIAEGIPELAGAIGIEPLPSGGLRTLSWDDIAVLAADSPPESGVMEQDLAYIMYTSGSTGAPKGMMHTHYSGLSYARLSAATYGVNHEDRLGNHSPLHFDMSTFEYFSGPLAGATTVIIPEAYTKLPASLSQLIDDERLTIWYSVPFALIQLLLRGALERRDLSSLRWINFGGEPFPPKHLRALMRRLPQARFSNVYGPAEVNQCTFYHVPPLAEDDDESVPIGRVWANAEGLVLDDDDREVSPGEIGELVVRTPTMMRGYWNRQDLNARAFYRRPVYNGYEDVFYRTGDLVQEMPDGNLKFLGRKDRQVKVRGHRVELDEIENVLSTHPAVEQNAVYPVRTAEGGTELEAAVIPRPEIEADSAAIRAYLAAHLPWYEVPGEVVIMAIFPRTTSGKIDRRALRAQAEENRAAPSPDRSEESKKLV